MKFLFKHDKSTIIALSLLLVLFGLLGYALLFKVPETNKLAQINEQSLILPLPKNNQEIEDFGILELEETTQEDNSQKSEDTIPSQNTSDQDFEEDQGISSTPSELDFKKQANLIKDDKQPIIALLIDGLDESKITKDLLNLPSEITFGIASTISSEELYNLFAKNHNLMVNIPLELDYAIEQEDNSLLVNNSEEENLERLSYVFSKLKIGQGVYTTADEKFTDSISEAEFLLDNFKQKNLIYLCGKLDKNAIIYQLAEKISFPILANDMILDEIISPEEINANLSKLEEIANKNGFAIATASPYPLTLELIKNWIPKLNQKKIKILPLQVLYKILEQRKALKNQETVQ